MDPEPAMASTDVPDLAPPSTPASGLERVLASGQSISLAAIRNHPLPSFDRTTVLLI
jgi:hypothetical protein